MLSKTSKAQSSQNVRCKIGLKESYSSVQLITSLPHSSKRLDQIKKENVQDCNPMKKKLFGMLQQTNEIQKLTNISPKQLVKQKYFVSPQMKKNKNIFPKKNNTQEFHKNTSQIDQRGSFNLINNKKIVDLGINQFSQEYQLNNQNKQVNHQKPIFKINNDQLSSKNEQSDRSTLLALFEKLNGKDSHNFHRRQISSNSNYMPNSQKHSLERDISDNCQIKKLKGQSQNQSSDLLNSITKQNTHSQNNLNDEDTFNLILEKSKAILEQYQSKLKQVDFEKEVLIQEIQYWKSKYQKQKKNSDEKMNIE